MDVTLERVQFKFASIIGELCSKPLILSQFAVWVDLRLSEYKLKGAISLDCSGDKPDPDWLKGIKDELQLEQGCLSPQINLSKVRQRNNESNQTAREVSDVSSRDFDNPESEALELRNSPNVSIKQEMDEEGIYPVGLHRHQAEYRERKRSLSSAGLNRGETSHYSQSPLKMRKSSDFSAIDTLQESNQSLMSIIGSDNDASSLTVEEAKNNIDLAMAAQIQDNLQQQMGDNSLNSPFTSGRPSQPSSTITKSSPYPLDAIPSPSTAKSDSIVYHVAVPNPETPTSSKRIRSDVKKFQSWLDEHQMSHGRSLEEISPDELDEYLAEFLGSVITRNGDPYDPQSLHTLRSNLNRHLKNCNYPYCLTKSKEFHRSQAVLKIRRQELKHEAKLSPAELGVALESNLLGIGDPLSLVQTMYCVNSLHFGVFLRTKCDHSCLRWGDLEIQVDSEGQECLVLTGNASRLLGGKHRLARLPDNHSVRAMADPGNPNLCPVWVYKEYKRRRSNTSCSQETRFYLMPTSDGNSGIWFHERSTVDIQNLGTFVRDIKYKISSIQHQLSEQEVEMNT